MLGVKLWDLCESIKLQFRGFRYKKKAFEQDASRFGWSGNQAAVYTKLTVFGFTFSTKKI